MEPLALYVHWPFCKAKCPYCDFNVHLNNREDDSTWIAAYLKSLDFYAAQMPPREVEAVFFGGGTPSLMPPSLVAELLNRLSKYFSLSPQLEVTLEANPTSAEINKFKDFKAAGVNRMSVGIQSLIPQDLAFLGRQHSVEEGLRAIEMAQTLFYRSSFDLIYARPGQTLQAWEAELEQAIALSKGHLSLYELTIEERTAFHKRHAKGEFTIPGEDLAVDFYKTTFDRMAAAGMPAYEISNYGAAGQECRYNVMTWEYRDYIGIGPGAHGRITRDEDGLKYASSEIKTPALWLKSLEEKGGGAEEFYALSPRDVFEERLIAGLRMTLGMVLPQDFKVEVEAFQREGWLEVKEQNIALTFEGLLRYDAITRALLSGRGGGLLRACGEGGENRAAE